MEHQPKQKYKIIKSDPYIWRDRILKNPMSKNA